MSCLRVFVIGLVLGACAPPARSQPDTAITYLGRTADLVAFATVERITETGGALAGDVTVQLRLTQVIKGQPSSLTVLASIAVQSTGGCGSGGGGGGGAPCIWIAPAMVGKTGIWFLKSGASGYQIIPRRGRVPYYNFDNLFLPLTGPDTAAAPVVLNAAAVDDALLAYQVRWFQSLADPDYRAVDEMFFSSFYLGNSEGPTQQQVLTAIAPLIGSSSPWQYAAGLVVALRVDSADAMTQVVNELSVLRSNPRFPEIVFAIGHYPVTGTKAPRWIAPLRQLLALHADIPGMDAAAAGALYRIGTTDTLPMVAELLESKDPAAQKIAATTLALRYGRAGEYDVELWKDWWSQNRAKLGFPAQ